MYQIFVNNRGLFDPRNDELYVIDCKVTLKENKAGAINFTLCVDHHLYGKIKKFTDYIHLYQDGVEIWRGRVISTPSDTLDGFFEYEGEGFFAVFNDTIQRPKTYQDYTVTEYLQDILNIHNEQVTADKQILLGTVTVTDPNNSIYKISNYDTTMEILTTRLIDVLGGYMILRYENEFTYLDYFADFGDINSQKVYYSINLIDIVKSVSGENLATAILPLGAADTTTLERITIKSVNNDIDFVQDDDAVTEYGFILKTEIFEDVTLPQNLLTKAYQYLETVKFLKGQFTINVFDLNLIDADIEAIKLGDLIICDRAAESPYLRVSEMEIYPAQPSENAIISGSSFTTMTDSEIAADKVINQIEKDYVTNEALTERTEVIAGEVEGTLLPLIENNTSLINQEAENIRLEVAKEYSTKEDLLASEGTIYSQVNDQFAFIQKELNTTANDLEGQINSNQTFVQSIIRFKNGNIDISRTDSPLSVEIGYDDMTFFESGAPGTTIDNDSVETEHITATETAQLVDTRWVRQSNGNNSLIWVG